MEKVLVTGATGYIGLHCIHQLLNQGYAVNGSVRSPERKDEIFQALQNHNTSTENLNIFTFDLNDDEGWDEGMEGCDYLLHVASPIALENHDEDFFVKPAVAGVNRAMKFAKNITLRKLFSHLLWPRFMKQWNQRVTMTKMIGLIQKIQP